jgi:hypothetical protein
MTVAKKGNKCQYLIRPKMDNKTIFKIIQLLQLTRAPSERACRYGEVTGTVIGQYDVQEWWLVYTIYRVILSPKTTTE